MRTSPIILTSPPTPFRAFMTDDDEAVLNYAIDSAEGLHGAALVTLVEVAGGTARRLGAQMAVRGDGGYCGYVSGGCTEAAVAAEAIAAIKIGNDRALRLGEGSPFFDIRLPCGGSITLAIHVIKDAEPLRQILSRLGHRKRAILLYDPASQKISAHNGTTFRKAAWKSSRFLRSYRPHVRLVVFGNGVEAQATAELAAGANYEVLSFVGVMPHFFESDIDQDTAVAILFHDIDRELPCLKLSLDRSPFYIGALGSKRTHELRCAALINEGYTPEQIGRIKAPIGLFGPTREANSLAVSVVADVANLRSQPE